jgi:hypothetical protein
MSCVLARFVTPSDHLLSLEPVPPCMFHVARVFDITSSADAGAIGGVLFSRPEGVTVGDR